MKLPVVQSEYFVPQGGQDIVSPALLLKNGVAFKAQNWECSLEAGYSRVAGYDKYVNGKTASEMVIKVAVVSVTTGLIMSGERLTGTTSGATMVFGVTYGGTTPQTVPAGSTDVAIYVTDIEGQFILGETLERNVGLSGATIYLEALPEPVIEGTALEVEEARATAEAAIRLYMDKPGSGVFSTDLTTNLTRGSTLGAFVLSDITYVVRAKNPALTATGNTHAVFLRPATPDDSVNRYWEVATEQSLIPTDGANFEFVLSSFADPAGPPIVWGVSGTYKAFYYTGTTFAFIDSGLAIDRPSHVCVHQNRLFISYKGSLMATSVRNSDPAGPTPDFPYFAFDATGAAEWPLGADITGLLSLTGSENKSALLVSTSEKLFVLYGSAAADFQLVEFSSNTGALSKTLQWMGQPIFQNIFGLTQMTTSSAFGGFRESTISAPVKTFLDARRGAATASMICRDKNQYRIFFGDTALYVTFRDGKPIGMFTQKLKHTVTCAWSCVLSDDTELLLIGTADGGIYKMDVGTSFAGETIPHHLRLSYNHFRSPRLEKHFKRTVIEARSEGYAQIYVGYDLDYGSNRRDVTADVSVQSPDFGAGGFWDDGTWDVGYWDGEMSSPHVIDTPGTGGNMSVRFQGDDAISRPVNVTGVTIDYTVRRAKRGP